MPTITHESLLRQGTPAVKLDGFPAELAQKLYRAMLRLRRCEEALIREYHPADEIRCPVHFCIGQEAVSASLSLLLRPDDYMFSHHRSHGYYLGKNAPLNALFAELYGKATGASGGKAGSQDISYPERHFYSGAILCGAVAIGVGAAFAEQARGGDRVVVTGFGEAATDEGVFWEAVNYAALKRLPIVFVCENNGFATSTRTEDAVAGTIAGRGAAFGIWTRTVDGSDPEAVLAAAAEAVGRARIGDGPSLLECLTYRFDAHHTFEYAARPRYRSAEEVEAARARDPVTLQGARLPDQVRAEIDAGIERLLDEAVQFAGNSPHPDPGDALEYLYADATAVRAGVA
jgi:pyruvate dehydrogenase E1 component alpha subunit